MSITCLFYRTIVGEPNHIPKVSTIWSPFKVNLTKNTGVRSNSTVHEEAIFCKLSSPNVEPFHVDIHVHIRNIFVHCLSRLNPPLSLKTDFQLLLPIKKNSKYGNYTVRLFMFWGWVQQKFTQTLSKKQIILCECPLFIHSYISCECPLFLGFNPLKENHFQSKTRLDSRDHRGICSHTKGLRKCCRVCIAVFWEEEKTVEGEDATQNLKYQRLPNLVANGEQNRILMHKTMFISVRLPKKALGMSKGVQMAPKMILSWVKMSSVSSTYMFFEV